MCSANAMHTQSCCCCMYVCSAAHLHALIPELGKRCPYMRQQLLPVLSTTCGSQHLLLEACAVAVQEPVYVQYLRLWQLVLVLEGLWPQGSHEHVLLEFWADVLD